MYNSNIPNKSELPSSRKLLCSTLMALLVACTLLITTVLAGEYGIDPTGVGSILGLTKMGKIKMELAKEATIATLRNKKSTNAEEDVPPQYQPKPVADFKTDTVTIRLKPGEAAEIKLLMMQDATVSFSWFADAPINFDSHGEPVIPIKGFYHGYGTGRGISKDKGILKAAFDGGHGWFWRNRTEKTVTLTLKTEGFYSKLKRVV